VFFSSCVFLNLVVENTAILACLVGTSTTGESTNTDDPEQSRLDFRRSHVPGSFPEQRLVIELRIKRPIYIRRTYVLIGLE